MIATSNDGGIAVAQHEPTIAAEEINLDSLLAGENVGERICAGLWGVDLIVRRPSGRIQIKKAEIEAADETGRVERLDQKKVTKPSFIVDTPADHEFWGLVDATGREAEGVLVRYSINDARRGFHLVPTTKMGKFLQEIRAIRKRRLDLVIDFRASGWWQYLDNLRSKFNGHFYMIESRLPSRESLVEKFDMTWTLHELAPISPSKIKFEDVNAEDQQAIIAESSGMAKHLIQQRAAAIYDEAFGALLEKCDEIAKGAMETGTRKFGGIKELMDLLDRAVNFQDFATNKNVAAQAAAVKAQLVQIKDVSEINANEGKNQTSAAIKAAFRPLGEAINHMLKQVAPGSGRARRRVEV